MTRLSAFPHAALDALGEVMPGVFYELVWREDLPAPEAVLRASWYRGDAGTGVFVPERVGGRVAGLLGERPEDILGDPGWWYRRLHPEDLPHAVERLGRFWRTGRLVQQYRIVRPDGRVLHVLDVMRLWRGPGGERRVVGLWMDVTDQATDRALLARAFQLSPNAIAILLVDDGRVLAVNQAFERLLGYRHHEVVGRTPEDLGIWVQRAPVQRMLALLLRHRKVRNARLALRAKDGWQHLCDVHGSVVEIMGEPCALIEAADVTEAERRRRQLAEHEARWHALVDRLPDGVLVSDDGRISYANPRAEEMFGRALVGATLEDLVVAEDLGRAQAHVEAVRRGGNRRTPLVMRRADGTTFPAEVRSAPADAGGGTRLLCVVRDRSTQEAMEERMREMQRMQAVATLAGGVAHDFNNILAVITGNLYLLRRELGDRPDVVRKLVRIEEAAARASEMIAQLLSFARERKAELSRLELRTFLKELYKLARAATPESITFEFHYPPGDDGVVVRADATQLQQAVLNLVKNAQDAVQGTPAPHIRLALDTQPPPGVSEGGWAHIVCEDNGPGIPEDLLARAFDPFFTTKGEGKGTGLGLAVVRSVAEMHGGTCRLENRPEGGTRAHLWLPLVDGAARAHPADEPAAPQGRGETVLLVDDDEILRKTLAEALGMLGYRVLAAASGEEALGLFRQARGRVDALVSDVVMPGMDGFTLARTLRAENPALAVVLQSGYDDRQRRAAAPADADLRVMDKPVPVGALARALHEELERVRTRA